MKKVSKKVTSLKGPFCTDSMDTLVDSINSKEEEEVKVKEDDEIKKIEELKQDLESNKTIIRDLYSENSIRKDLPKVKSDKTYTEEEVKEKIADIAFINEAMKNFNKLINEEAKSFLDKTIKYEDIEDEMPANILLKIAPTNEKEREIFKDKLITSGEKRRPVYITIGEFDLFFEYIDKDDFPIFSFNRQNLAFFFGNDLNKFKDFVQTNKCTIQPNKIYLGLHSITKTMSFDNLMVEIIEKKKKKKEEPKTEKVEEKKEEVIKEEVPVEKTIDTTTPAKNKKVCKVRFTNKNSLFILTEDPSNIFKEYNEEVYSIKVIGEGISI